MRRVLMTADAVGGVWTYAVDLARDIFRFLPLRLTHRDLDRIHGVDERIGLEEYETARTYRQILL